MTTRFFSALQAVGSLILGFLLYVLFRENTFFHSLFGLEGIFVSVQVPFGGLLRYYFPDFLWAYSLCCSLMTLYPQKDFRFFCPIPWVTFGTGLAFETAQFFHLVRGTGDLADILLYLSAAFAAYGSILQHQNKEKKQ